MKLPEPWPGYDKAHAAGVWCDTCLEQRIYTGSCEHMQCARLPAEPELAGWRPLAAGLTNGETLLVVTADGLHRVRPRSDSPGYLIEKTPLDVLRVLIARVGLALIPTADANTLKFESGLLQWPGGGMNLDLLRSLLSPAGLAIIPAADVPSAEERKVLEDVVRVVADWIDEGDEADSDVSMQQIETVARAQLENELARRAANEGK